MKVCSQRGTRLLKTKSRVRLREQTLKENLTNAGREEQRQINQRLDKAVKKGREGTKDVEARTVLRQHRRKDHLCQ